MIVLIGRIFTVLLVTGDGNLTKGDGTTSILCSVTITLLVMCVYYTKQKLMTTKQFGQYVLKGVSNMLTLVILLVLAFAIGSVVSGGIFWDHCSPILSSMSVGTDLFFHVKTQLPYALVTAAFSTILYIVFGLFFEFL